MKTYKVFQGDNLDLLSQYPDNYFDSVVTDCPYGLGKEPDATEMLKAWVENGYMEVKGSGFMGKQWDAFVPQPIFWKEVFRVLKHGGHVLSFFGTRTYDWGVMAMRLAGFEVRDCIQWLYGCLSDDTEILTKSGWVKYSQYNKEEKDSILSYNKKNILVYDKEKDEYFFEIPKKWNEYTIKDTCYRIESDFTDQIVSRNHRCLIERNGSLLFEYAEILSQQGEANMPILESIFNLPHPRNVKKHKSYSTTLATITPFEYSGVIFCPTVSTGCFVARRNGKIFITGNSGFPKALDVSKAIDKMYGAEREVVAKGKSGDPKTHGNMNMAYQEGSKSNMGGEYDITKSATEQAKQWEGWKSALKPANEPIVLARKPLEKGLSIAENVLKWGTGALAIDKCRISTNENITNHSRSSDSAISKGKYGDSKEQETHQTNGQTLGRFPANLILTHHPECECKGLKKVKAISGGKGENSMGGMGKNGIYGEYALDKLGANAGGLGDENGEELVEDWACHDDCPIKLLDEQSITMGMHSAGVKRDKEVKSEYNNTSFHVPTTRQMNRFGDKGGASRFFHNTSFEESDFVRFQYVAKASKSERNKGLDGFEEKKKPDNYIMPKLTCSECGSKRVDSSNKLVCGCNGKTHYENQNSSESKNNLAGGNKNTHPTVKPIKLMQYLVRLITPPNGIVLDPFCGSGTTGIACKLEEFNFIGLEQDPEYCKIAEARINNYVEEKETKKSKNDNIDESQLKLF